MLKSFKNDLVILKSEIEFSKTPILDIIEKISQNSTEMQKLYDLFLKKCNDDIDLNKAWESSIDEFRFERCGKELLYKFPALFTSIDVEGQASRLNAYQKDLEIYINNLEEHMNNNSKLYKSAGLYGGILLAILLI